MELVNQNVYHLNMPAISILMAVLNEESYLNRALESIRNQSFEDFEVVIVNDASIDGSRSLIESVISIDDRFLLINNDLNMGLPRSLNLASKVARGEYQVVMGGDDYLGSTYLEAMHKAITCSKADFVYSDYYLVNNTDQLIGYSGVEDQNLLICGMVMGVSRLWKKSLLDSLNGFDEKTFMYEDYEFSVRVLLNGSIIEKVGRTEYYYRIHDQQLTKQRPLPDSYYGFRFSLVRNELKRLDSKSQGRAIVAFLHTCLLRREFVWAVKVASLIPRNIFQVISYLKFKIFEKD